jgi:hypothetical protein
MLSAVEECTGFSGFLEVSCVTESLTALALFLFVAHSERVALNVLIDNFNTLSISIQNAKISKSVAA